MVLDRSQFEPVYSVNTPPIKPPKIQGMRITLSREEFRFSQFEPLTLPDKNTGTLSCGTMVTLQEIVGLENGYNALLPVSGTEKLFGLAYLNQQRILLWDEDRESYVYQPKTIVTLATKGDYVMRCCTPFNMLTDEIQICVTPEEVDGNKAYPGDIASTTGIADLTFTADNFKPLSGFNVPDGAMQVIETIKKPGLIDVSLKNII